MATGTGTAFAGTNYHCDYCIINSGAFEWSDFPSYITLEYVHRLSGPSSGVTIGAIAYYTDNGTWGNWATSTATEVTHAYSGSRPAYGVAANFGAGNYRFNAHMNY